MNKIQIGIIVVAVTGIFAGISYYQDHAYEKQKFILEEQLRSYLPEYCPLAYVTHGNGYVNVYCELRADIVADREERRTAIEESVVLWQKTNPGYASHSVSVYFTSDDRGGDPKK